MSRNALLQKIIMSGTVTGALNAVIHRRSRGPTSGPGSPWGRHLSSVVLLALGGAALLLSDTRSVTSYAASRVDPDSDEVSSAIEAFVNEDASALQGIQPTLPGRVLGIVQAMHGDQPIALPGVTVSLERPRGHVIGETARSNAEGRYEIPSHLPGTYRLCAQAPGFIPTCAPKPVVIAADTQYLPVDLTLSSAGGALHGRVLLADGSPCYYRSPAFKSKAVARVSLTGPQGRLTATGNARGEFILGSLASPGAYTLNARCQGGQVTQPVTITPAHLEGSAAVDLTIANSPPVLRALSAQDEHGQPLRTFSPGQTIQVVAVVSDPDGDALHFKWTDGGRGVKSVDAPQISWTLPDVEARSFLNVEMSDGKGGFALHQFTAGTSDTGARFIGTLVDPDGTPMAQATVTVDGLPASVDAEGNFRVAVPVTDRHVLTVKHPGHALLAQIFHDAAPGLKLTLKPATRVRIDPSRPVQVQEQGITLALDADQLVDPTGHHPRGLLNLDIYRYDVRQGAFPGDPTALALDGSATTFIGQEAVAIDITDDAGTPYELAPGSTARLAVAVSATDAPGLLASSVALARYDETRGIWMVRSAATLTGQHTYEGRIGRLAVWSVGRISTNTACVGAFTQQLDLPFELLVSIPHPDSGGFREVRRFTVTQPLTLIPFLPEFVSIDFEVTPFGTSARPIPIVQTKAFTGANVSPPLPPFPFLSCNGFAILAAKLPAFDWLNRFVGNETMANNYYGFIGARPAKATFAEWLNLNGFSSVDTKNEVVFYNPNELGLGRRVNCKRRENHEACYVIKYGSVGGSPVEAFDDTIHNLHPGDTVAMEANHSAQTGKATVTFYIYGPDGNLSPSTHFDSSGPKFVPHACQHCHGRPNGEFVVLDPYAYQYPGVSQKSPHGLDKQQEKFRLINQTVNFAHPTPDNYTTFLSTLYPQSVHAPGAKAIPAPTPLAWQDKAFIYNNVVKPACRTCHMWQGDQLNFDSPADALILGLDRICKGQMPNAQSPMIRLWKSTHPNLIQALADSLNVGFPDCIAQVGEGQPPTLNVFRPADTVSNKVDGVDHFAVASDSEDGPGCCTIVWSTDKDGEIGVGNSVLFTYPSLGPRLLTVTATDSHGRTTGKSFPITITNGVPELTINVTPSGTVGYGGLNIVTHTATVRDVEDGPTCCPVVWTSDKDGQIGTGKGLEFVYPSPGLRRITATATDRFGNHTDRVIDLNLVNTPPIMQIPAPAVGTPVFQNKPVVFRGKGADANEITLPCTSLEWTSSNASDTGFPFTGCKKTITFTTRGLRTITLTGTDAFGATATTTRQINVQAAPAGAVPRVTLVEPDHDDVLEPTEATASGPKTGGGTEVGRGAGAKVHRKP